MNIKDVLKHYRIIKGYSYRQLSRLSGVCHTTINDIERGICNPSLKTIIKLCEGLEVDIFDFLRVSEYLKDLDINMIKGKVIDMYENQITVELPCDIVDFLDLKNAVYIEGKSGGYLILKPTGCFVYDKSNR